MDPPFFFTMLARFHSMPDRRHVAQELLMNCRHKSDHDRTDPVGSPMNHVPADDDRQMGK
jgi:hypothetical protein